MTKNFCDNCGELVGKAYCTGRISVVTTGAGKKFQLESKIKMHHDIAAKFDLCVSCAYEVVELGLKDLQQAAHKEIHGG